MTYDLSFCKKGGPPSFQQLVTVVGVITPLLAARKNARIAHGPCSYSKTKRFELNGTARTHVKFMWLRACPRVEAPGTEDLPELWLRFLTFPHQLSTRQRALSLTS